MISLTLYDAAGRIKRGRNDFREPSYPLQAIAKTACVLAAQNMSYAEGDYIEVATSTDGQYVMVKLDETLAESLVYIEKAAQPWRYAITFAKQAVEARPEARFKGQRHCLTVRLATAVEISQYQNVALNPYDQKAFSGAFPHATANVETRNDATFFACNAIDGCRANLMHGSYPYQSWGINQQKDAQLTIEFGREVLVDRVVFTFRADFPHDSYWTSVKVAFSDGSAEGFVTKKTAAPQSFSFEPRVIKTATFCELEKAEDDSPFPALTQIEFWGKNN